jgi:hypothetical protein
MAALQVAPPLDFTLELRLFATYSGGRVRIFPEIRLCGLAIQSL